MLDWPGPCSPLLCCFSWIQYENKKAKHFLRTRLRTLQTSSLNFLRASVKWSWAAEREQRSGPQLLVRKTPPTWGLALTLTSLWSNIEVWNHFKIKLFSQVLPTCKCVVRFRSPLCEYYLVDAQNQNQHSVPLSAELMMSVFPWPLHYWAAVPDLGVQGSRELFPLCIPKVELATGHSANSKALQCMSLKRPSNDCNDSTMTFPLILTAATLFVSLSESVVKVHILGLSNQGLWTITLNTHLTHTCACTYLLCGLVISHANFLIELSTIQSLFQHNQCQ